MYKKIKNQMRWPLNLIVTFQQIRVIKRLPLKQFSILYLSAYTLNIETPQTE